MLHWVSEAAHFTGPSRGQREQHCIQWERCQMLVVVVETGTIFSSQTRELQRGEWYERNTNAM